MMTMSSAASSQKNREKAHLDMLQSMLGEFLKEEDNKYCADCEAKGPRWASWNIGVFLCIRCAGCHRNLGVHISRVKSVNLDSWNDDQVSMMQQMGNKKAKLVYEALLPENFRRPQTDYALEQFIRAKYEQKRYFDRSINWEAPKPKPLAIEIPEQSSHRSRQAGAGGHSPGIVLPPVPSGSAAVAPSSTTPSATNHRNRTSSSSSLSPPLSAKTINSPQNAAAASNQRPQQQPASIIDFFDDAPAPTVQSPVAQQQPRQAQQDVANLAMGVSSISLTPPGADSRTIAGQGNMTHSATSSAFEDLSFLGAATAQPQKTATPNNNNSHPQQHHQRSVSNYDLMMLDTSANKQNAGAIAAPSIGTGGGVSGISGGSGGLDDILSLYKQTPVQQPVQGFGGNFPMYPQQPPVGQGQPTHQRNFSDAMAPIGGGNAMFPQQQPQPFGNFGGFGMMPQQQQPQFQMQPQGIPSAMPPFMPGGFQPSPVASKPAMNASSTITNSSSSQRDAFDSLWQ